MALGREFALEVGSGDGLGPRQSLYLCVTNGAQIRHMAAPDVFAAFGHAAAVRVKERLDGFAAVGQHLASRGADGGRGGSFLGGGAGVELAVGRRAEVVALAGMAAAAREREAGARRRSAP